MKFQENYLLPLFTTFVFLFVFSLVFPTQIFARSGCCSHHGGVCGCGCCDGTSLSTTCAPYYPACSQPVYVPVKTLAPLIYYTPKPTIKIVSTPIPTLRPTLTPIPTKTPTATPTQTPSPTPTPQVQGAATQATIQLTPIASPKPTAQATPPSPQSVVLGLTLTSLIIFGIPIWIIIRIVKKFRSLKA